MRRALPLLLFCLTSCAQALHLQQADNLRQSADLFHQRVRWKDFGGAAELLVPERRGEFAKAYEAERDEPDLQVTDYELLELTFAEEGGEKVGRVVSRISWVQMPSLTVHTERMRSDFISRGAFWLLAHQERGPFTQVLGAPYSSPATPQK